MAGQPVIAVSANPALANAIEQFLHALEHNGKGSAAYVHMMSTMTDRMIGLFMIEPVEIAQIGPTARKIVDVAVSTGSRASSMLTGQIYGKTSNKEFAPIAADLRRMLWAPGDDNGNQPHLHFPASATLARDFQDVIDLCVAGKGTTQMDKVVRVLQKLSDDVIEQFFLAQTKHVDIGFITKKALNLSVDGTKAAVHAVMHKVVKDFNDEQLTNFMSHYSQILKYR